MSENAVKIWEYMSEISALCGILSVLFVALLVGLDLIFAAKIIFAFCAFSTIATLVCFLVVMNNDGVGNGGMSG